MEDREFRKLQRQIYRLAFPINDLLSITLRIGAILLIYYIKQSLWWALLGYFFPIISLIYLLLTGEFKGFSFEALTNFYI